MSAFALPMPPPPLARELRRPTERSATAGAPCGAPTRSFGAWLQPRYIFGAGQLSFRPVSYYAFFKGWLLLSQHPLPLSHDWGTLAGGLGCFPLDDGP